MADFRVDLQQPGAAGATPVAPVSNAIDLSGVANVIDMFGKGLAAKRKEEAAAFEAQITDEYAREKARINDALAQGTLKPETAAARTRALFNKYAGSYSGLIKSFKDIDEAFVKSSAIGEVFEEEQSQQELFRQLKKDAQAAGMVIPQGSSKEYENAALTAFQASRAADVQFKRLVDRNSEARSQSAEERANTLFQTKQESGRVLSVLAQEHFTPTQLFIDEIRSRQARGEAPEALLADTQRYFSNIEAGIVQATALNPELGGSFKTLFDNMRQIAVDTATGKIERESQTNQLTELKNKLQLIALGNPRMQALYTTSALLGGNLPVTSVAANDAASALVQLADITGTFSAPAELLNDKGINTEFLNMVRNRQQAIGSGKLPNPAKASEELSNAVNNYNAAIGDANVAKMTSEQLAASADFYASPEYAKLVAGGGIDKQTAARAQDVLANVYTKTITRGVEQKLQGTFQFSGNTRPSQSYADLVDVQFTGAGVDFQIKKDGYLSPVDRQDQQQFVRELSASKKAINQMIHMGAHMEGHQDYSGYWERNKHIIMPSLYPDPMRLKVGQVEGEYEYIGGPPASPKSWKKVEVVNE